MAACRIFSAACSTFKAARRSMTSVSGSGRPRRSLRFFRSRRLGRRLVPITSFGLSMGSFLLNSDVIVFDGFLRGIYICVCGRV